MTDLELLEMYEPALRFAKSERFFPMAVDAYLEQCAIFPSGPQGVMEIFAHFHEPLITRIGNLTSEQYYLRFVNKPLNNSDARWWWRALSALGLVGGWLLAGRAGVEITIALALLIGLIIFMFASPIRLRIIPAALDSFAFIALEIAPIWFFLRPNERVSFTVEYFILLPIYVIGLLFLFILTMKFFLRRVIPEVPGLIMDMLSQATEKIAQEAYAQYAKILEKEPQPLYYGRVVRETDKQKNQWTILQYHFFYAFNDWRLAANGINHHEGDWEMVAVYLKNDSPYAALLSQHGVGYIEKWKTTIKVADPTGNETTHPVIYVALGSHANYSKPGVVRSPSLFKPGTLQRVLFLVDSLIHFLFLLFNPDQKTRQAALAEIQTQRVNFFADDSFIHKREKTDQYVVRLPMEIASGDGFRVGAHGEHAREGWLKSGRYLKRVMSQRKTTKPAVKEWRRELLNSKRDWVQYKGLWGVKSWLSDESGPPGPKWDRPKKNQVGVKKRIRWDKPLDWLAELEKLAH
jgi:hypothetical protein